MRSSDMKIGAVDLNLLVVFDAIMQERSVTRAGRQLGLSQSTMSHALARLRHLLKDDVFVRTPKGMVPTPRAEQLAWPVRRALQEFQKALEPPHFDPAKAKKTFRIAVDNFAAVAFVSSLVVQISDAAPGVTLDIRPSGTCDVSDLFDRGELDLAVGPFVDSGERFSWQSLLQDEFVIVMREDHPAARLRMLSFEDLAGLTYLEISSHHFAGCIDPVLAENQIVRRVGLRAPFISAAQILSARDLVCVLPRCIALELTAGRRLVIRALPKPVPTIDMAMIWPRWMDSQAAHRWLRQMVVSTIEEISRSTDDRKERGRAAAVGKP